jgi:hypothetical protein
VWRTAAELNQDYDRNVFCNLMPDKFSTFRGTKNGTERGWGNKTKHLKMMNDFMYNDRPRCMYHLL